MKIKKLLACMLALGTLSGTINVVYAAEATTGETPLSTEQEIEMENTSVEDLINATDMPLVTVPEQNPEAPKDESWWNNFEEPGTSVAPTTPVPTIKPEALPPIADFVFLQDTYVAGQEVFTLNTSRAQSGKQVVQSMWMVDMNPATKTGALERVFKKPRPGSYLISLKVKDNKGVWSEWTTKVITILPNEKPVVTGIQADKEEYEKGESISLTYTFTNETWEPIVRERWSYRGSQEAKAVANPMKPEQIFDEGDYIVTLSLEDKFGNISDTYEYTLKVNDKVQKYELKYKFDTAWPGTIIDNMKNFNFQEYKEVTPESVTRTEGKLIMSNSPEQVSQKGILYQDTVSGRGRMIIHHVNNFGNESNKLENKNLVVLAENRTVAPITLSIRNQSIKGPVYDVLTSGQEVLNLYLMNSANTKEYSLAPGQKIYLYNSAPSAWHQGRIISGLFDFEASGDVTFTSAISNGKKTIEEILAMPIIPRDGVHNRGTFNEVSREYVVDLSDYDEPVKLVIGNKGKEEWVQGIDMTNGDVRHNMGNYGLSHYVTIKAKDKTGVFLNPRGGVYRGTIGWDNGQLITTPLYGSFTQPVRAATLGVVDKDKSRTFEYILPNGSAAPILFGFVPESYWEKEIGYKK